MKIGAKVCVMKVPDGVPPDNQVMTLFRGCVGKTFPIVKTDDGLVELHVGVRQACRIPSDLARAGPTETRRGLSI